MRILLTVLLFTSLSVSFVAIGDTRNEELLNPMLVVSEFQKFQHYEIFCKSGWKGSTEPIKVGKKFESYLSKEFNKLFLWSQCVEPEFPPFYEDLNNKFLWDIRFGNQGDIQKVKNIRIKPVQYQGPDKASVILIFDPTNYELKNIVTTYTLIREDGHWKIDDIAPKGDFKEGDENYDAALKHSASIKTDMQNNYNAALERYKKEQALKGTSLK